jgi:hypothetical protein
MPKPTTTTRLPQLSDEGVESILTVSEGDVGDRQVVAVYERPMGDYVGPFALDGTVEWTNSTSVARTMSIRLTIQLSDGINSLMVLFLSFQNSILVKYAGKQAQRESLQS